MTELKRKPALFALDDPRLVVAPTLDFEPGDSAPAKAADEIETLAVKRARRGISWGALFWSALSGLVLMALGLTVTNLVNDLFSHSSWLGILGLTLASIAGIAFIIIVARELVGMMRLAAVDALRNRAADVIANDNREAAEKLIADMLDHTRRMPRLARGRARLQEHRHSIIDGRDLALLAERELMTPLDAEAKRLVVAASKRVSVLTAISPRASIDLVFALVNALDLIRKLAALYGGRPGVLGVLKLFRRVMSHLAITGGVAVTDSVIQQLIGHGLAARLSARLGEGMVNGLLTARLGLLTMDLVRPMPFSALPRPALNQLAGSLLRSQGDVAGPGPDERPRPPNTP
jgi:putative membrane protein